MCHFRNEDCDQKCACQQSCIRDLRGPIQFDLLIPDLDPERICALLQRRGESPEVDADISRSLRQAMLSRHDEALATAFNDFHVSHPTVPPTLAEIERAYAAAVSPRLAQHLDRFSAKWPFFRDYCPNLDPVRVDPLLEPESFRIEPYTPWRDLTHDPFVSIPDFDPERICAALRRRDESPEVDSETTPIDEWEAGVLGMIADVKRRRGRRRP